MRTRPHLKARPLIIVLVLCCAFLGHTQFETRDVAEASAENRRGDISSVGLLFSFKGKVYESRLPVALITSAPGWIPSEPLPFPAHKAVEAAAPVARSFAGSLGSWKVSQINLSSLDPPKTQSWYYGVSFEPSGPNRSNDGVIVAVDFAGRIGPIMPYWNPARSFAPVASTFASSTNTAGIGFTSWFDGSNEYVSDLSSRRIMAAPAPEWVLPQPSPFPAEKAVYAALPVAYSLVGDADGWYVARINLYSLPQRPESWCYKVGFRQEGREAIDRSVNIGVDFAGRIGTMRTNGIISAVSDSNSH